MTGPDNSSTRPISVAELLAKNGTIGAPPAGGRRRRRRGNADAVTVAELTGEIPVISERTGAIPVVTPDVPEERADETGPAPANGAVEAAPAETQAVPEVTEVEDAAPEDEATVTAGDAEEVTTEDVAADDVSTEDVMADVRQAGDLDEERAETDDAAEADYTAHLQARDSDPRPVDFRPQFRRPKVAPEAPTAAVPDADAGPAEEMSPDPDIEIDDDLLDDGDLLDPPIDLDEPAPGEHDDELPSYFRSPSDELFGGDSVADGLARRGRDTPDEVLEDADEREHAPGGRMSGFLRGAWIVGQCILAVAFGAGLFIAFDQLWKWNNIVALVLSVLVILGLVVGVRVVRKTEDIGSTLIAVAVGALVTLGPLALLQSG
jgi:hypothetical protein